MSTTPWRHESSGDYRLTVRTDGGTWEVYVSRNYDGRWDVTCDWGDTYRGAPTSDAAREIAERFAHQRFG